MICVDYKATIWGRLFFEEGADVDKIIQALNNGEHPGNLTTEEYKFSHFNFIDETEEFMLPEDNHDDATIEVIDYDNFITLWDNSINISGV